MYSQKGKCAARGGANALPRRYTRCKRTARAAQPDSAPSLNRPPTATADHRLPFLPLLLRGLQGATACVMQPPVVMDLSLPTFRLHDPSERTQDGLTISITPILAGAAGAPVQRRRPAARSPAPWENR